VRLANVLEIMNTRKTHMKGKVACVPKEARHKGVWGRGGVAPRTLRVHQHVPTCRNMTFFRSTDDRPGYKHCGRETWAVQRKGKRM
jgi:hypothetical protein